MVKNSQIGWDVEVWTFDELKKIVLEFQKLKNPDHGPKSTLMDQQYYSPANSEGVSIDSSDRKDSADINSVTNPSQFTTVSDSQVQKKSINTRSLNRERFVPSKETQNQTAKSALDKMFADLDLSKKNGNTGNHLTYDLTPKPTEVHESSIPSFINPAVPQKPPTPANTGSSFEINEKGEIVFINPIPDLYDFGTSQTPVLVPNHQTTKESLALAEDDFFLLLAQGSQKTGNQQPNTTTGSNGKPTLIAPPKKADLPTNQSNPQSKTTLIGQPTTPQTKLQTPPPTQKPAPVTSTTTATPGLATAVKTLVLQPAQPSSSSRPSAAPEPGAVPLSVAVTK